MRAWPGTNNSSTTSSFLKLIKLYGNNSGVKDLLEFIKNIKKRNDKKVFEYKQYHPTNKQRIIQLKKIITGKLKPEINMCSSESREDIEKKLDPSKINLEELIWWVY